MGAGRAGLGLATAIALIAASAPARAADSQPNGPDWAFGSPAGEIVMASVCAGSMATFLLPQRRSKWGAYSSRDNAVTYGLISDFTGAAIGTAILATGGYFLEASYYGTSGADRPFVRSLRTSLIEIESASLASGIAIGIKRIVGRCRPRAWKLDKCGELDTDFDAFPSGHTTPVAAIAGARFALAINTTGERTPIRFVSFGIAEGATLLTAYLRVAAGAHSWEDVVGGWIIGHTTGVLVTYLHPVVDVDDGEPSETSQPLRTMLSWSGSF